MEPSAENKQYDLLLGNLFEITGVKWDVEFTGQSSITYSTKYSVTQEKATQIAELVVKKLRIFAYAVETAKSGLFYVQLTRNMIPPANPKLGLTQSVIIASPIEPRILQNFKDIELATEQLFHPIYKGSPIENPAEKRVLEFDPSKPNRFSKSDFGTACPAKTALVRASGEPFKVHANRVQLAEIQAISAQAPKRGSEQEFWKAVAHYGSLIVDLTNRTDRIEKGVGRYYPIEDIGPLNCLEYGDITITYIREQKNYQGNKCLKLHEYHLCEQSAAAPKEQTVCRLHFRGWPDYGAISLKDFENLINCILQEQKLRENKPVLIHCRAGVGRSGTVIVGLALLKLKEEGKLNIDNFELLLQKLILDGREQRGLYFVQSKEQYALLHEYAKKICLQREK